MQVEVTEEPRDDWRAGVRSALVRHPEVGRLFASADLWVPSLDADDKGGALTFTAVLQDVDTGRLAVARGRVDDPGMAVVEASSHQLPTTEDEHGWAESTLRADHRWGPQVGADGVELYRPMPPLGNVVNADGTVQRVINVGIRTGQDGQHQLVGIRTGDGTVLDGQAWGGPVGGEQGLNRAPGEVPVAASVPEGGGRARLSVLDDDGAPLWSLVLVRPQASSGLNGSGVELRQVEYQERRVFHRAHVPIATVEHGDEHSLAWRLWLAEEAPFHAPGEEVVPGLRLGSDPPRTVLDGEPGGDFQGVYVQPEGDEVVITSQLQAGWYRYVVQWRLGADGTVRPRVGAAALRNPISARPHAHRIWWRLDFDVHTAGDNLVQEHNDPPVGGFTGIWTTTRYTVRRSQSDEHKRYWRVRHRRSGMGYTLTPRHGGAGELGGGDPDELLVLPHKRHQLDDGQGVWAPAGAGPAQLDRLVSGDPVHGEDVVVWYGVHLPASAEGSTDLGGPDLVPFNWRRPVEQEPFPAIAPPMG